MALDDLKHVLNLIVRVVPRSSKSEIVGEIEGILKVRLSAPPIDGAANEELVRVLAKKYRVAKSDVTIVSGAASRLKRVQITGTHRDAR